MVRKQYKAWPNRPDHPGQNVLFWTQDEAREWLWGHGGGRIQWDLICHQGLIAWAAYNEG